jgi:hypothetical protein
VKKTFGSFDGFIQFLNGLRLFAALQRQWSGVRDLAEVPDRMDQFGQSQLSVSHPPGSANFSRALRKSNDNPLRKVWSERCAQRRSFLRIGR